MRKLEREAQKPYIFFEYRYFFFFLLDEFKFYCLMNKQKLSRIESDNNERSAKNEKKLQTFLCAIRHSRQNQHMFSNSNFCA